MVRRGIADSIREQPRIRSEMYKLLKVRPNLFTDKIRHVERSFACSRLRRTDLSLAILCDHECALNANSALTQIYVLSLKSENLATPQLTPSG